MGTVRVQIYFYSQTLVKDNNRIPFFVYLAYNAKLYYIEYIYINYLYKIKEELNLKQMICNHRVRPFTYIIFNRWYFLLERAI